MTILEIERIFSEPDQSYFLFGPRGTGKSTLVRVRHPDALMINLLEPSQYRHYSAYPERLLEVVRAQPPGKYIVIDEIQKIPALLPIVHILLEEKKNWLFILTGSSARKLKQTGVDLLGGRALKKTLHPFMASELGQYFNFEEVLQHGLLPLRYGSNVPREMLSAYVSLYLDEEVKSEGLVRQIEPFLRFLEILSFSHGSTFNMSNIARECAVKRNTAASWLSIVEDLLIAYTIPIFKRRAKRILTTQEKLYFFDVGVYRALRPYSVLDQISELDGAALEGLIAQHLRAWMEYTTEPHTLYFWRTKSGLEVDFIVYGTFGLWAIEVKNSQHINPADLRSLQNFQEDYPEAQTILLYRGKERIMKNTILCMPCEEFIRALTPNQVLLS